MVLTLITPASTVPPHQQFGFSLLEVLVTVVVVSIGILGILGMQTASMINTRVSASRSNATVAADNFAARMRANPDADYDGIASTAPIPNPATATNNDLQDCSASNTCDEDDIKAIAVWEWSKTLQRTLPNGRGFVDCLTTSTASCDRYRITVAWDEHDPLRNDNTSSSTQSSGNADFCDNDPPGRNITARCFVTKVRP